MENDHKFIKRCIQLSKQSVRRNGKPFGALIVRNNEVLAESINGDSEEIVNHPEIVVIKRASDLLQTGNLSDCTLYSNCEPCPMCSFIIREYKLGRIVFALLSPHMGGLTKWNILKDKGLSKFTPEFGKIPKVTTEVCKSEASLVFNSIGWTMHKKNGSQQPKVYKGTSVS